MLRYGGWQVCRYLPLDYSSGLFPNDFSVAIDFSSILTLFCRRIREECTDCGGLDKCGLGWSDEDRKDGY